jgi:signal transduction histidine kinase
VASGLAVAAVLLCLLCAALPAFEAGIWLTGLASFGLSASAAVAAAAAFNLHMRQPERAAPLGLSLLDGVAGTLRDALSTIKGFAELLAASGGKAHVAPEMREACRFILEASEDLTAFVSQLQDFVRHEAGRMRLVEQPVDAAELVEAALAPCRRMAERADVFIIATLPDGVELRCDPTRLRGAIASLVLWVARGAPKGSVVAVRLDRAASDMLALRIASIAPLPASAPDAPFDPDLARDGLNGFALPIARRVALLHSGTVTIEAGANSGTTACLSLPPGRVTWPKEPEHRAA